MIQIFCQIVIISFLILSNVYAQDKSNNHQINWVTLDHALDYSYRENKKILIDVYTDWCGWCKIMHKKTYSDQKVIKYVNEHYLPVRLNAWEKKDIWFRGYKFKYMPEFKVNQLAYQLLDGKLKYPTTVIMTKFTEVLTPIQGYVQSYQFLKILKFYAEDIYKEESWKNYNKKH